MSPPATPTQLKNKLTSPSTVKQEPEVSGAAAASNGKVGDSSGPAEICVVIGGSRNAQAQGSYVCGICGKKYKYYNCFQTHVRAHRESEGGSGEGGSQAVNYSFRYTCDICGKNYKYYSCFQEHRDLHAVDGTESLATGSYVCEFCGKQYKYFNPYQEHVALHTPIEGATCRKREGKMQASQGDTNSSQNSSGEWPFLAWVGWPKPYTCGACGIQFQFYNNLLEHMQSHAADNENHTKVESPKTSPAPTPQEQVWKPLIQAQRNHNTSSDGLPEKERQQVAERLLRVMCADPGLLGVLGGKDFLKLAQTLVDSGARHGAYSVREGLGDMGSLALRQLPRTYNQVKVKVTCALGSSASLGIAVTCHSQTVGGAGSCYVLSAYQVEGVRLRRYVLGVKEVDLREPGEQVHHWVQNVLSEFVMSDVRAVYVTEPRAAAAAAFCGRVGACLRCAGCSLGAVAQAVLGKRSLQTRGLHELAELLAACRDIAGAAGVPWDAGVGGPEEPSPQAPPPPCWDRTTEALLKVHQRFDQICEVYGRSKSTAPLLQSLNKHLLATLASLLAPLRQAAVELSSERRPTLQMVLPAYLRLEKLFTSKAGEAGAGSKLCHYFLEALKENFKVERVHQVAMVLDPQLKLRPVPAYQHEEIIGKVCEAAAEMKEGPGGGGGVQGEDCDSGGPEGPPGAKRCRAEGGDSRGSCTSDQQQVRKEVFQYLAEPLFHATPDLFQYWSSVMEKYPRLARLALWLLAVPAVGVRGECAGVCEQALALKRRQQVTAEEMNKLIFLRSNMS
uniref:Zinc finger protein 618 n=1 Tax=Paramormyrops kingsleyae TaxID=1676925 RepID=A0A3B3RQG7_9TELE